MPGDSTTGAPDWRDAAKLRKFLADDIPQWTPSEGAENTRAFLAALREKCSTEIGAMTGLLLALFEERVDASKAGYELAQKLANFCVPAPSSHRERVLLRSVARLLALLLLS